MDIGAKTGHEENMKFFIDDLRLSPYTYSVLSALIEKGAPYEMKEVSFADNRSVTPAFAGRTFTDLIPAIDDDGFVLSESLAILEYLEEKYPAPQYASIHPAKRSERAHARMLLSWYRCGMQALRKERSTETVFYPEARRPDGKPLPPLSAEAREEVADLATCLKTILKPGAPYLFGDRWSIADTETALMLHRLILNGDELDPGLREYAESLWNRPSIQEFVEHPRKPFRSYYA